jgi:hypothetical protein
MYQALKSQTDIEWKSATEHIGEIGRSIPGGGAVDRFPMTEDKLEQVLAAWR